MPLNQGRPVWPLSLSPCEHLERSDWRRYRSPHTGKVTLRTQCLRCGMAQDICTEGDLNAHDVAAYQAFDETLTQRYLHVRWKTFEAEHQRLAMNPERRSPRWYRDTYLKTTWWTTRRRRALADADWLCERCRKRKAIQVHHLNYRRLFRERREDLQALCWDCHRAADRARQRVVPQPPSQMRLRLN